MTQAERSAVEREVQWHVRLWMHLRFPGRRVSRNELVELSESVQYALGRALGSSVALSPPVPPQEGGAGKGTAGEPTTPPDGNRAPTRA